MARNAVQDNAPSRSSKKRQGSLRVAKKPISLQGIQFRLEERQVPGQKTCVYGVFKGPQGTLDVPLHPSVRVVEEQGELVVHLAPGCEQENAIAGTMRALLNNAATGVRQGFTYKLLLVGVGYKAQLAGQNLTLTLGHSHPVVYTLPATVKCQLPTATEMVLQSADKALLGQVCAEIIAFRPQKRDPYKGKGVRMAHWVVVLKETKKKK